MTALRHALGAAFPSHHMDPETVASITRAMRKIEMREKAQIIAAPMRALMDLLATGEAYEIDGREFGKPNKLRVTTIAHFRSLLKGYRHPFEVSE